MNHPEQAMDNITIIVPGPPVPWARVKRGTGRGGPVRTYKPARVVDYQKSIAWQAKLAMNGRALFDGAVEARIEVWKPIPPSWPKWRREQARHGVLRATGKPDIDNYYKIALDALNEIVYCDDSQVCELSGGKAYATDPRMVIHVWPIGTERLARTRAA